jgi:demethylmenaquinone methyltransferase/2-methoxy-6-polyprenyl-1,4-benzoquinol methylase
MPPPLAAREALRKERFADVWTLQLDAVFADVAPYYDRANDIAALGLWKYFRRQSMATIAPQPGQRVLDVCAGTNAVGIGLLEMEPTLEVHAMDRSAHMQAVGKQRAEARGFHIASHIGDVTRLPFPDNHFDVVTLQFASRHLMVREVFSEILRVLKPGGRFHHSDMLRPANPVVEQLYYAYLRASLLFTSLLFGSGKAANGCRQYFIDALKLFYSPEELSLVMRELGFVDVTVRKVFFGMLGSHCGVKPGAASKAP